MPVSDSTPKAPQVVFVPVSKKGANNKYKAPDTFMGMEGDYVTMTQITEEQKKAVGKGSLPDTEVYNNLFKMDLEAQGLSILEKTVGEPGLVVVPTSELVSKPVSRPVLEPVLAPKVRCECISCLGPMLAYHPPSEEEPEVQKGGKVSAGR